MTQVPAITSANLAIRTAGALPGSFRHRPPQGPPGGPPGGQGLATHGWITGSLAGRQPTTFEGDRDKSEAFMDKWNLYYLNNRFHVTMATPYQRVTQCLTHISGPKVTNWKKTQVEWLNDITTRQVNPVQINDPWLWNTFCDEFTHTFADTMEEEQAERKLQDLYMKGSEINDYNCNFKDLI
jgi:Retrotransposon gag protein